MTSNTPSGHAPAHSGTPARSAGSGERDIQIADYNYPLPEERIARYPLPRRDQSKLLVYRPGQPIEERRFHQIADLLPEGSLMVINNTRVIHARLHFKKATGAAIEVFLLEPHAPADYQQNFARHGTVSWICMVGNLKKWKGETLSLPFTLPGGGTDTLLAERGEPQATGHIIRFSWSSALSFAEVIEQTGELPIPPYLGRATEESDLRTYQTVYSKVEGSVAAPTAGLHFTPEVLAAIGQRGIELGEVTLHVGAGTFRPVKTASIGQHAMHAEWISVSRTLIEKLIAHGSQSIAVGTTSVRTLESLYHMGCLAHARPEATDLSLGQWTPYEAPATLTAQEALTALLRWLDLHGLDRIQAPTQIIIVPGYTFRIVKAIITNFHQPQSTLLLLVSAFVHGDWHRIYDYALGHGFRFLSYGDSSLLLS